MLLTRRLLIGVFINFFLHGIIIKVANRELSDLFDAGCLPYGL